MKNLDKFGVQELGTQEMREVDGGKSARQGECVNGLFDSNSDFKSSDSEKLTKEEIWDMIWWITMMGEGRS